VKKVKSKRGISAFSIAWDLNPPMLMMTQTPRAQKRSDKKRYNRSRRPDGS
jgi:hypothetical protein